MLPPSSVSALVLVIQIARSGRPLSTRWLQSETYSAFTGVFTIGTSAD